jgi:hypothetical protein
MDDQRPEQRPQQQTEEHMRVREALVNAGLSLPYTPPDPHLRPLPPAERDELAQQIKGKPLSQMIIEDRDPR